LGAQSPITSGARSVAGMARTPQQTLGERGETEAAQWLIDRGLVLLARNIRRGRDEADLVFKEPNGNLLIIVEVKTRASARAWPEARVDAAKAIALRRLAHTALIEIPQCSGVRIDVLSVNLPRNGEAAFHWFKDAIAVPLSWLQSRGR